MDKCATLEILNEKEKKHRDLEITDDVEIKSLELNEGYKYLGMMESNGIHDKTMRDKVKKEYYHRIRTILRTQLNSRNKMMAINSLAIPVIGYSFGVLKWSNTEIEKNG